jgi:hypothetical protein
MQMKFPQVPPQPMLLTGKEIIEGELRSTTHSKKTTTTTTKKATKKEAQKDGHAEPKDN